jgi:hypothetical protein
VIRRQVLDVLQAEAHEAVALALHALHHRRPVDAHAGARVHPERRRVREAVGGLGRGDQQLRRHAADARAGRPE